jgi:malate synthase
MDVPGAISQSGLRTNISVGIQYLASWLAGTGAAGINNLMEDVATAEISRSQVWQWAHHGASTEDGTVITESLVRQMAGQVVSQLEENGYPFSEQLHPARKVFEEVALGERFVDFLTLSAYELIN